MTEFDFIFPVPQHAPCTEDFVETETERYEGLCHYFACNHPLYQPLNQCENNCTGGDNIPIGWQED